MSSEWCSGGSVANVPGMRGQTGGVITGGLTKTVLAVALVLVVLYDAGAVTINAIQLDDIAGSTLRTAQQTWASSGRVQDVEAAVLRRLELEQDVELEQVDVTRDEIILVISRVSRTLVAHRIPPLEDRVERTVTKHSQLP
jgi:hypothetical protein